jgi:two-component system, chemotaxis family, protein-glutamate methylesterase/glutaminase
MGGRAVVIGGSAGGMQALAVILPTLPADFSLPVAIVIHVMEGSAGYLATYLNGLSALPVLEACDKEPFKAGTIYVAPAGYPLLIEADEALALSVDEPVSFARPAIDVLFESAAEVYGKGLIGIVLTGANRDGSRGLKRIKERGGLAVVQDPAAAEAGLMPRAAIETAAVDHILPLAEIGPFLAGVCRPADKNMKLEY